MKTPIDTIRGKIVDINEHGIMTIKAHYDDWRTMIRREYREVLIQMIDGRPLSDKQRKTCYAILRDISNHTGMGLESTKEWMKIKFLAEDLQETADKVFSLSSAPMSLVCAFQRFIINFILDWEIPCSLPLAEFADDIEAYIYACATKKRCCVCGAPAEAHHYDRVGMGRNRETIDHTGMKMQPLCRLHHTECHTLPQEVFDQRYHLVGAVIDRVLLKIWKLHGTKPEADESRFL